MGRPPLPPSTQRFPHHRRQSYHGGATTTYQIVNTGTSGAALRGAIQTTGLTDSHLFGSGVTPANYGPIATGASSEPGTLMVLGTALMGLCGLRRRRA